MMQKPVVRIILAILVLAIFIGACVLLPIFYDFGFTAGNDERESTTTITVAAASDLIPVFEEIGERFNEESGFRAEFTFGSSGLLAQQVEAGAPIDVYVSANQEYVAQLNELGLLIPESVQVYAIGRVVVWSLDEELGSTDDLAHFLEPDVRRVAIGNTDHAPYGVAGKQALMSAGIWDEIQDKLVFGSNIRETLQYAETGNVDVAIVALSLALASEDGHWTLIPADAHESITQTLGIVAATEHEQASRAFVEYVTDETGRATLERYGFEFSDEDGR
jgi:molybdate transport system substrate-binding protein